MSWTRRFAARVDVRLAAFVGGLVALLNAALVAAFAAFAMAESLEEAAAWLERSADEITQRVAAGSPADADADASLRNVMWYWTEPGATATTGTRWEGGGLRAALLACAEDSLVRRTAVRDREIEVALPLAHFATERDELARGAAAVIAIGTLAALGFGAFAARRALAPVRAMERAVASVTPGRLDARVPERGTRDDVDALATSINAVLERLQWSFERIEGFSADVAHELRTPIQRVLVESQLALLDGQPERLASALSAIHETAERMSTLVNHLLLLASGEEGRLRLVRERVVLRVALEKLVEFYAPVADGLGKSVELTDGDADGDAAWACDRGLVERAVANLIENALVHAESGAKIRVVVVDEGGAPCVGILDSGPGIPAAQREIVFERFVRLDAARSGHGSGLGLSIARMIARLHGGDLWADASPLGGTAFWMRLPPDHEMGA